MTSRHKHRIVRTPYGSWLVKILTKPRWRTYSLARVERSPYPYGLLSDGGYYLSILGVLHRWTGLTLEVYEP